MYSWIERQADRQTDRPLEIGNIEVILRFGRKITSNCQSPMLCLSWGLAPTDANPAFGPAEQGGRLGMSKVGGCKSMPKDSDILNK